MKILRRGIYRYLLIIFFVSFFIWSILINHQQATQKPSDAVEGRPVENMEDFNFTDNVDMGVLSRNAAADIAYEAEEEKNTTGSDLKLVPVLKLDRVINFTRPPKEEMVWKDAILLAGNPSRHGEITIGIPTMYRPNASYLHTTLKSIISNMAESERQKVVCVIFLSGNNVTYAKYLAANLTRSFPKYMEDGFIRLITAPQDYYPSLENLKQTYNDKMDRVKWRSKQNLDYAFLIRYCRDISTYYLQIEDDVLVAQDFFGKILLFIKKQKKSWAMLDYSGRGFIGKLFRSQDLPKLAHLLRAFFDEQPCDFLINYFSSLLVQPKAIVRKPSLFKHIGYYSTLKNQVRKLDWPSLTNNPSATVNTSIETYGKFYLRNVYETNTKFWGKQPVQGDTVYIVFEKSQLVKKILIQTGEAKEPTKDMIQHAVLEAGKESNATDCKEFVSLGKFSHGGIVLNYITPKSIRCLRIRVTEDQDSWLVIRKIAIVTG